MFSSGSMANDFTRAATWKTRFARSSVGHHAHSGNPRESLTSFARAKRVAVRGYHWSDWRHRTRSRCPDLNTLRSFRLLGELWAQALQHAGVAHSRVVDHHRAQLARRRTPHSPSLAQAKELRFLAH